jgi:fructoselysine transporter
MSKLERGLSLTQAVAINTIDMVGIGPFIVIPFVIGAMHGPQCIIAWILGAVLAFSDGFVWAELGAKWPEAGGSYVFLQNLYGRKGPGRLMSFLYVWQTIIQAPLVAASGAIGFSQYLLYLLPSLTPLEQKAVSGGLIILITILLYRKITDIGKISVFMGIIVGGTILWLIISGFSHFQPALAFTYSKDAFDLTPAFFIGLGMASTQTIYSFLGYYNVCHLGGEIKKPERNIPRSIFISIAIIAVLYFLMQIAVLGVIPWQEAKESKFIVSLFFERIYGHTAALIATGLILFIALSSLFAVMLGYSRVPYAAAVDGNFFSVFSKLHSTKNFPHVSLLFLAGLAFVFSLLFKLTEVITAIIVMRILVQFLGQSFGIILYHQKHKQEPFPFRMWLYPMPAIVGIAVWLFVFCSADLKYILGAQGVIIVGALLYYARGQITAPSEKGL